MRGELLAGDSDLEKAGVFVEVGVILMNTQSSVFERNTTDPFPGLKIGR
tara:strand:+ start:1354 stop:1500 length:147 start_codon:yes stop_codon:yes gene_type:complete